MDDFESAADLDFVAAPLLPVLADEIRLERLLEKASEDAEEMGLCFCLEGSRAP